METTKSLTEESKLPARSWLMWLLVVVAAIPLMLFLTRPTRLAALTVIPTECWLAAGLFLQVACLRFARRWSWRLAAVIWLMFFLMFIEPPVSMLRSVWSVPDVQPGMQRLRVVSLNCDEGTRAALRDLISQHADLVLLQESPGQEVLQQWARELFGENGSAIWGPDCSILARGKIVQREVSSEAAFVCATWEPSSGLQFDVASLRLWPQPLRFDYWNRENWDSYAEVRKIQMEQMDYLQMVLKRCEFPMIVGGDFNCPPSDPAETPLRTLQLKDGFQSAGRGWGKTIINRFPFHRIDRLWHSPELQPVNVVAVRTSGSDHRLLRCDLDVPEPSSSAEIPVH